MSRRIKDCGKPECEACKELFAEHRKVREARMSKRRKARNVYQCGRCLGEYTNPYRGWYCPHCFDDLSKAWVAPKIIGHQEYHPSWFWSRPSTWFSGVWVMYPMVVCLK